MVESIRLTNTNTQESILLDKLLTPNLILDNVSWGAIESTHNSFKYINQVGISITNTVLGTRSVEISAWIIANSKDEMTEHKLKINRFFNPQEDINLYYSKYMIQFRPDTTVMYSNTYEENNDTIVKFKVEGICANPLFADIAENKYVISGYVPMFHFPLSIPSSLGIVFGYKKNDIISKVLNGGDVQTGMRIVIKALGTLTNPYIVNTKTLDTFKINKNLVKDEEIIIDTNVGERTILGHVLNDDLTNYFAYKDIDSNWLQLNVGNNYFACGADSGSENLSLIIYATNKYLEVQECE